ncbi:hypothetical protein [Georgenia faecalis]|uniref:Uncharacterized protein n=1 Tax=Georgenia faecalis TaxID=2483799 RepID=A0ABV9DF10_9MICO|nr:hypothetical protein [Georgenia faecalis]
MAQEVVAAATAELAGLAQTVAEGLGGPPRLAELLEVLGWGAASLGDDLDAPPPVPVELRPRLRRGATPAEGPSRAGDLGDAPVVDAGDLLGRLAARLRDSEGRPTLEDLATLVGQGLRGLPPGTLADVDPGDVTSVTVRTVTAPQRAAVGDVVAIPATDGTYHLGVVLDRNVFGTALGLFRGTHAPRPPAPGAPAAAHAVYTDDEAVADGHWRVVGHDENLIVGFPDAPEVLHRPGAPGVGPYGAAERPDGALRDLGEDEARERGVLAPDFQQIYAGRQLERHLGRLTR